VVANPIVEKAAAWIEANCCAGITETQVADYCQYNVDYLNRLFKSVYSKTIKQYVNEKRMEHIKELMLCDNVPLKVVAARAGFSEYKYFLKFFKYHENITPTEFYKQYAYVHINSR
jgi:YesN/AraC family two-component response regulator